MGRATLYSKLLMDQAKAGVLNGYGSDNQEQIMRLATVTSWVYSDISLIADRTSDPNLYTIHAIEEGKAGEKIENHPITQLLKRPNALMSGSYLLRVIVWWIQLTGNGYIFLSTPKVAQGPVLELWPLSSNQVTPMPETLRYSPLTGELVIDYEYINGGVMQILPGENVAHFRLPNPYDYWQGLSPLTGLQLAVRTDFAQARWLDSFFGEDNAIPTSVISVSPDLGDEEFDAVKRDIQSQFGAGRRSAITRAGDMTIELVQHAIAELQVLEGRKFNQAEIDRVYRVPAGIYGDAASGDSRLGAEISLAKNALQPMLNYMAETLSENLAPYWAEQSFEVVAENIIPQERSLDLAEYSAWSPDRTIKENREVQDLDDLVMPEALKDLQALIDSVPVRLLDMAMAILKPEQPAAPGGQPGQPGIPIPGVPAGIAGNAMSNGTGNEYPGKPMPSAYSNGNGTAPKARVAPQQAPPGYHESGLQQNMASVVRAAPGTGLEIKGQEWQGEPILQINTESNVGINNGVQPDQQLRLHGEIFYYNGNGELVRAGESLEGSGKAAPPMKMEMPPDMTREQAEAILGVLWG